MLNKDDLPANESKDVECALVVINELKSVKDELMRTQRWSILQNAMRLHKLYHEFSMREECNGEFDRTLVSLLHNVVKQLPKQLPAPVETFENGSGI